MKHEKIGRPQGDPSNTLPFNSTPGRHNLKCFKVDIPTTIVANFTTLAETEAEAVELINAALAGNQDAQNRVTLYHSPPLYSPIQIQVAEPGTLAEKSLLCERTYPLCANVVMGVFKDEN